ncbi:uncharacterized protein LOC135849177 [Planococcus citri]|uniref:uncharacterized protein LOC135849177 n=1 Tax=Planococcus citri TaxID=170843 RepID=UPI0031F9AEDA
MKKVAIIGAGLSGLAATKRVTESPDSFECCTFELSDNIGGTWVYTDKTGKDEHGIPIHSSMYQGLRTNLPKEVMEFPEFPHKNFDNRSYLTAAEVLRYVEDYAEYFNLKKYIKFLHYVKSVAPIQNGRWEIQVTDLQLSKDCTYYFDSVMICVGNYSNPDIPSIPNIANFQGLQLHSHDYREPSRFKNQTVVVIGAGSSGMDISCHVSNHAEKVYLSHHNNKILNTVFPENLHHKPDIQEIRDGNILFKDGSEVSADTIIYCTGYLIKYPFLDEKCKIKVENNVIKPLYKRMINIEYPTMGFIGALRDSPNFDLFDLQARCFLNILKGVAVLPSTQDMLSETEREFNEHMKRTNNEKSFLSIKGHFAKIYFDELSRLGKLPFTKPVLFDIYSSGQDSRAKDFKNFRTKVYRLINDREYIVEEQKVH